MEGEMAETPQPEPVKERQHIELKFDHAKSNVFEAMGFTDEDGMKFFVSAAKDFNDFSMKSETKTELVEYIISREKDEQAVLLLGILRQNDAMMRQAMISKLGKLMGIGDDCDCPDCTERRAREADQKQPKED